MIHDLHTPYIDPTSFRAIADLTYRESGLQLVAEKTSMIQSRLRHRLKAVGLNSFQTYANFVCSEEGKSERIHMISALTTNVSHFFREKHHFDILTSAVLPSIIENARRGEPFRIWSAGCSNGQEAYSIVMSVLEAYPEMASLDFKVLATDIDPKVIEFASQAEYPERFITGVPKATLNKYFNQRTENGETLYVFDAKAKSKVTFKHLNFLAEWPMRRRMNAIFCRNVVIYFDSQTQNQLWPKFNALLDQEGKLFLGHSERIADPVLHGFINDGHTAYRPNARNNTSQQIGSSYVA